MTGLKTLAAQLPRVTALIGGGGKTSLLYLLGRTLAAQGKRVVLTTTTHLAQDDSAVSPASVNELNDIQTENAPILAAYPAADGRMTGIPAEWYDAVTADYILVEADGSRRLPLKVHRSFEPVLPPGTELVIQVAGLSALGQTVGECVHCYHEMGLAAGQTIDEEWITKILLRGFERCSTIPRRLAALNQADTAARLAAGETIQRQLARAGVRAAVTRLKGEVFCLF